MGLLKSAENSLADLYKNAPKLSNGTKESIVNIAPWLALIGSILNFLSALSLYRWASVAKDLYDAYSAIGAPQALETRWTLWVWLAIIFAIVQGVLLLLAFPKLKKRVKAGWDIVLLSGLISIAYSVVGLFISGYGFGGGFGSLIMSLIVTAFVFWLLFGIRDKYKGSDLKASDLNPTDKA